MNVKLLHICSLALGLSGLGVAVGSCGKVAEPAPLFDSNTNWLRRCASDAECSGSLRCYCGICTKPCGQDSECERLLGAQCEESGEVLCGEQASAGGLCVLACGGNAECGAGFDCVQGQCVPQPCFTGTFRNWDEIFATVNSHLGSQDADDRQYLRYFVIGQDDRVAADAGCGIGIEQQRQALVELVNRLSLNAALSRPVAIDDAEQIYSIDLRDYDWDRPVFVRGQSYPDVWEALSANDPYALPFIGDDADDVVAGTRSATPVLLADALLASATEPRVYYGVLDIEQPASAPLTALDDFLLIELGVDPQSLPELEAGFDEGGTEFLAQYWPLEVRAGYVWMISELADVARGSLFLQPLDRALGDHELIYTLPNGLNAFLFMSGDGTLIDGWSATGDAREPEGRARAPRSNLRRHTPRFDIRDQVRQYVDQNSDLYDPGTLALIRQRFPGSEALASQLRADFYDFTGRALNAVGLNPDAPNPLLLSLAAFDADVTLEKAAAELMSTPEDLRDNLGLLEPALQPLAVDGGTISRSAFTLVYADSLCVLSTVLENQPDLAVCP